MALDCSLSFPDSDDLREPRAGSMPTDHVGLIHLSHVAELERVVQHQSDLISRVVDHFPSSKNFIAKLRVSVSRAAAFFILSFSMSFRHSFSIFNIF